MGDAGSRKMASSHATTTCYNIVILYVCILVFMLDYKNKTITITTVKLKKCTQIETETESNSDLMGYCM